MTPTAAIHRVLDSVYSIELDGDEDELACTLLGLGTTISAIALAQLADPREREAVLQSIEHDVRDRTHHILLARRSMTPKAANGHGNGHAER
jgi:hypothetical protein